MPRATDDIDAGLARHPAPARFLWGLLPCCRDHPYDSTATGALLVGVVLGVMLAAAGVLVGIAAVLGGL